MTTALNKRSERKFFAGRADNLIGAIRGRYSFRTLLYQPIEGYENSNIYHLISIISALFPSEKAIKRYCTNDNRLVSRGVSEYGYSLKYNGYDVYLRFNKIGEFKMYVYQNKRRHENG